VLRFIDGFDHYDTPRLTDKWNNATGAAILSGAGRVAPGNAVRVNDINSGLLLKTLDAQATWIVGFAFNPSGLPAISLPIVRVLDAGNQQVELRINPDGTLAVTSNGAALTNGQSTVALRVGAWCFIEFMVTISTSILASSCEVKLNNAVIITVAAGQSTQATANPTANAIDFHGSTPTSLIDDVYICDGNGGTYTTFIGDSRVILQIPAGAGDSTQWSLFGNTNNWKAVSNVPPLDDAQYVYSNTPTQLDLYVLSTFPLASATIKAIQTVVYERKDDTANHLVEAAIKTGGTVYTGTPVELGISYLFNTEIHELNPHSGIAWTVADLNALQTGIELNT
jgi:hypothetical protein